MELVENIKVQYEETLKVEEIVEEIRENYIAALEFENEYLRKEVNKWKNRFNRRHNDFKEVCDRLDEIGLFEKIVLGK